jgi:hypothetical protein
VGKYTRKFTTYFLNLGLYTPLCMVVYCLVYIFVVVLCVLLCCCNMGVLLLSYVYLSYYVRIAVVTLDA